ncbi:Imm26 family immunity protein [Bacillus sp. MHSD_36]|uniref:Imm26 family immunity protein n=1 Tax=unclassified Bacillus (in: firmicutes) TaxID=185979 RepID=UPI002741C402|nr:MULTISPECIES: Imm26 family immunity protein [unclassified Bacillus (in: firmicutes)]MDP7990713.1 Imm26 family immunity protein [Bacillus sp. MHSD_36]MDR4979587.1 Imm26 family immunity protein [Bacillus sp. MHSD_37]
MESVLFNELNYTLQIGKIRMFIPDSSSKEYIIFEDLAELLNLETNYDAMVFIRNQVKEAGIKGKVRFDSESDCVEIYSTSGKTLLQVTILVNELIDEAFTFANQREYEQFIGSWKRPEKQKWKVGDVFSIPLPNETYFFGQIVELMEDVFPLCVIFDLHLKTVPTKESIDNANILTALMLNGMVFDDYTFKVIFEMEIMGEITENTRRNPVRNVTWSTSHLVDFCMEYKLEEKQEFVEKILANRNFVIEYK